ncbi:hypothetical protein LWC05_08170 [Acetobacter sicerae]|uniref:Uncharacterized protein n=1 Tax=Acetobacter sicerae TaxID=85325 RepID=A0ABS8VUX1_9PROT|nr:hypothetical protein [Acetobacter sicerae]MCE0743868.1 hypothetical protein [Acetobacter sicerae]
MTRVRLRLGYADPPYVNCAHLYRGQPDYAGEVDHAALVRHLDATYDGWVLHAAAIPASIATLAPLAMDTGARWMVWVKGFAAFKRNVPVAYAWEPVIIKAARRPVVSRRQVMRDWIQGSITLRRGLTGAKPEAVCHWAFELLGARPDDVLDDLYPGTGAVTRAWESWRRKFVLPQLSLSPPKRHPDDPPLDMLMPEDL